VPSKLRKLMTVGLAGALLLAACAERPRPRVGVKNVAAELVFGIPPVEEPLAPAGVFPDTLEEIEDSDTQEGKFLSPIDSRPPPPRCAAAGPNDFPETESPPTIQGKPKEGSYLWKIERLLTRSPLLKTTQFDQRRIEGVVTDAAASQNFRFKRVARDPGAPTRIETLWFRVDNTTAPPLQGLFLERIDWDNPDDSAPAVTLDPEPNLMFLPTPVQQGPQNTFDTVGVAAGSFGTIQHRGYVKERQRVDACGKVIDSWFIDGEQVFTFSGGSQRRNFDYSIATQFGAMIAFEHVQAPCSQNNADGTCTPKADIEYDAGLGQTEPSL
jgi:hypothetical protein